MNFRFDTLYGFKVRRPDDVVRVDNVLPGLGIPVRESPFATRAAFRIVKSHPRARRKRYSVERFTEPCAMRMVDPMTGRTTLIVHPTIMAALRREHLV